MSLPDPLDIHLLSSGSRRLWSPNMHNPASPSARNHDHDAEFALYDHNQRGSPDLTRSLTDHRRRGREPSDVSVEALDLADYARTLRPWQIDHLQHGHHINPQDLYSRFPRSTPQSSSNSHQAPSLVSRGKTLSTSAHSLSSSRRPVHRLHSLPDTARIQSSGLMTQFSQEHGIDNEIIPDSEIDVSHFPSWSRNWYQTKGKANGIASPPDYDLDAPPPARISMFDPSFKPNADYDYDYDLFSLPSRSTQHPSQREYYLPWSSDPMENGLQINTETKEERMRMLEHHFGRNAKPTTQDAFTDENGKPLVGTVDSKGYIVTEGPVKRAVFRVFQIMLALVAGGPSIYAALLIRPKEGAPPPAGKPAAFVLYALSVITTFGMLYLYVFRRCCGSRRKIHGTHGHGHGHGLNGMMVLPVQGLPGGKNEKKQKRKKGKHTGGDVQVNLIVDPNAFGLDGGDDRVEEEDDGWGSDRDSGRKRRGPRRRSVFAGLAMEKEWKRARVWLQKMTLVDAAGLVLWGGTFVLILLGERCPSGGYDGWCNAYNISSAAACLLCIAFGTSIFFDIKDLFSSKTSPRTRR